MELSTLLTLMSEDIVGYIQTIHLMMATQNKQSCHIRFLFDQDAVTEDAVTGFTWKDIQKSAFGAVSWDYDTSPVRAALEAMLPGETDFGYIVDAFLRQNRDDLCARIAAYMQEEGFENFTVIAEDCGIEIQIDP